MRRLIANTILSLFAVWFALLDRCLIAAANMPISGEIVFLLVLQAGIFGFVVLLANGIFQTMVAMASSGASARVKFIVFAIPLILFMISPVMIADSMYRARYGNIDKFVVHAHVGHDLACCLNPLFVLRP
jgi:hypothetical protein